MILLLRTLVRVLSFLLLVALAAVGGALAVFSIQGDTATVSLPHLAQLVQLPALRTEADGFFTMLERPGPVAIIALLSGLGAVLLGLLLLAGLLLRSRGRSVRLEDGGDGRLDAGRRPLSQMARELVEETGGVTRARVRVRPRRRGGGRLSVVATRSAGAQPAEIRDAVREALRPLTEPFGFTTRVRVKMPRGAARVQ